MTRALLISSLLLTTLAGCMNDDVPMGTTAEPVGDALSEPSDGFENENMVE